MIDASITNVTIGAFKQNKKDKHSSTNIAYILDMMMICDCVGVMCVCGSLVGEVNVWRFD